MRTLKRIALAAAPLVVLAVAFAGIHNP
jgi:hypothetical protein